MKSALITEANRSIGLETAKQLSKKGLFVYLGTRNLEKGEAVVKQLYEDGFTNIKAVEIDVTNRDTILAAQSLVESEQGKLDILINNAGVSKGFPDSALTTPIHDIQEVFNTNFFGAIQKYYPFKMASYVSSKAALNSYTVLLAYELKDLPFKVNAVDPGYTATDA